MKPDFSLSIILIGTENSGNIGAIARVMKNFDFSELILINPLAQPKNSTAFGFAMHARDILEQSHIHEWNIENYHAELQNFLHDYDMVIGTSAQGISYRNIKRIPLFLTEFDFSQFAPDSKIALVFGRESTGLTNAELSYVDFILRIPTGQEYPTLNLSHAVGIILYHIHSKQYPIIREQVHIASLADKNELFQQVERIIERTPLASHRYERSAQAFHNLIGRAVISRKEFEYLRNLFRKILLIYDRPDLIEKVEKAKKKKGN